MYFLEKVLGGKFGEALSLLLFFLDLREKEERFS